MMLESQKEITLHLDSSINWKSAKERDMDFTLVYKGLLRTRANAGEKHAIRQYFHPQLKELWKRRLAHRFSGGALNLEDQPLSGPVARRFVPDIARDYEVCGHGFVPLVTEQLALGCRLDIFFLSKGLHQRIVANADFDNRLKSLFDGLRRPNDANEMPGWIPTSDEKPLYCLLTNDSLITDIRISGDSLLDPSITDEDHYHLFIRVRVRPLRFLQINADFA
jgi:hypothetical protein